MSNPMRAPSATYVFSIPYSGTLANGDCVLLVGRFSGSEKVHIIAYYKVSNWIPATYVDVSDDKDNHILHIKTNVTNESAKVAFVPGPNH